MARRAATPDPECPPGMVRMSDRERLDTLQTLSDNEADIRARLFKMPLHVDTPSLIKLKAALEAKLQEVEGAMKIFDRPKVFIAP